MHTVINFGFHKRRRTSISFPKWFFSTQLIHALHEGLSEIINISLPEIYYFLHVASTLYLEQMLHLRMQTTLYKVFSRSNESLADNRDSQIGNN
jgi:hypothetical protein